jgi:hypothetical protein
MRKKRQCLFRLKKIKIIYGAPVAKVQNSHIAIVAIKTPASRQ